MGFDEETGDGHHIYWAEKQSITVERSVKFNFKEEIVVGQLPLEEENANNKLITPKLLPSQGATINKLLRRQQGTTNKSRALVFTCRR